MSRSAPFHYHRHSADAAPVSVNLFKVMRANKKRILEAVLFDWDGTLLDSFDADSSAYLAMFREMGIPWGLDELSVHYSPNWYNVYRAAKIPRTRWDAANLAWRKQYDHHKPKLVSGARRLLAWLGRRYRLGLVTSGERDRVTRQLRYFGLTRSFASRVCADDTAQKKPHPAPLRLALKQMNLEPTACVYVGDSPHDLEMARRAGVRSIAVLGRFPTEKGLRAAHPEFLLDSLTDLPAILDRLRE
jgi:HAD superfamily hydrolase (TIGR01549 family)